MTQDREDIKFSPITLGNKKLSEKYEKSKVIENSTSFEYCCGALPKGKYDINYVIKMLEILIEQCDFHALKKHDLPQSLRQSCKSMIAKLRVEKLGSSPDPGILITCAICEESLVIPRSAAKKWKCPCENGIKMLEMIN